MMNTTMTTNAMAANVTEVMGRSAMEQGGYQMAALCLTLAIAIVGGVITGNLYLFMTRNRYILFNVATCTRKKEKCVV